MLAAIRAGNTLRAAAMYAGISEDTVANWRRSSSAFSDSVTRAEAESEVALVAFCPQGRRSDRLARRHGTPQPALGRHDRVDFELRLQPKRRISCRIMRCSEALGLV